MTESARTNLLLFASLALLAGPVRADLAVNTNLGTLELGDLPLTGTTLGGPNNANNYTSTNPSFFWGSEFVFQFTLSTHALLSLTSDDPDGGVRDNDFFLLGALQTTPSGNRNVGQAVGNFVQANGEFGLFKPGTYFLVVDAFAGQSASSTGSAGPFNAVLTATALPLLNVGGTLHATLNPAQVLWYSFVHAGGAFSVDTLQSALLLTNDTELFLFDQNGVLVAANDDDNAAADVILSRISLANLAAGTYFLAATGYDAVGGPNFFVASTSDESGQLVLHGLSRSVAATVSKNHLELRRENGQTLLDYWPGSNAAGSIMLHFSPDLFSLSETAGVSLFEVPANAPAPITWDVTSTATGPNAFFSTTAFVGLSPTDFTFEEEEPFIPEEPPTYNLDVLTSPPEPLVTNTPLTVHFQLTDGTTNAPVALDGSVRISLQTTVGDPVGFAFTLTPETLPMTDGLVNGSVVLTTSGPLTDAYLAIVEIIPAGAAGSAVAAPPAIGNNRNIGPRKKTLAEYQNTVIGWNYPLPSVVPIAGSFGEWRSSGTAGRPHQGMDFAAAVGSAVQPVKRGVVSHVSEKKYIDGKYAGYYMTVVHGDGTASRYLHVKQKPGIQVHSVVETTTVIATVEDIQLADHLHLELRSSVFPGPGPGGYVELGPDPGHPYDPGRHMPPNTSLFDVDPIQSGVNDSNAPEVKALHVFGKNPRSVPFNVLTNDPNVVHVGAGETAKALVMQILDKEGTTSGRLVPAHIRFSSEDAQSRALVERYKFDYGIDGDGSTSDVRRLFQNSSNRFKDFGYVRRTSPLPKEGDLYLYQYWFHWDTSGYASEKVGPRQVQVYAADRVGHTTTKTFTFGPQLLAPPLFSPDLAAINGSTFDLKVQSMMGPAPQNAEGGDELTIQLTLPPQSVYEATLEDPTGIFPPAAKLTFLFVGHGQESEQTLPVRIKRKSGMPAPIAGEELVISARSGVFPDLWHEVKVPLIGHPTKATITVHSYAGTQWEGSPVPRTIEGFVNAGDTGSTSFFGANGGAERGSPLFSTQLPAGVKFYVMNQVNNVPPRPGSFAVNRLGHSSFVATLPSTGEFWVLWSGRAVTQAADWEYHLRYDAGKPGVRPPKLEIGVVPNADFFNPNLIPNGNYEVRIE